MENKDEEENEFALKKRPKLLNFVEFLFDDLGLKNWLCKKLIFRPPNPKNYEFDYITRNNVSTLEFTPLDAKQNKVYFKTTKSIKMDVFLLENKKNCKNFEIPLLHFTNLKASDGYVIIYSHGNGSDLGDINVIGYDYTGYGIGVNKYQISENSLNEDLDHVISFAINHLNYPLNKIILWGFSLGSGPTIELASRFQNLGGIILQSPLASLHIWIDKNAEWDYQYKSNDMFSNIAKIESIKSKIFLLHGKKDEVINIRHSNLLYEKYTKSHKENNQIWYVISHNSGHNDMQYLINEIKGTISMRIKKFLNICKLKMDINNDFLDEFDSIREKKKESYFEKELLSLKFTFNEINFVIGKSEDFEEESLDKNSNGKDIQRSSSLLFVNKISIESDHFSLNSKNLFSIENSEVEEI